MLLRHDEVGTKTEEGAANDVVDMRKGVISEQRQGWIEPGQTLRIRAQSRGANVIKEHASKLEIQL